jgi:hypothetical protein
MSELRRAIYLNTKPYLAQPGGNNRQTLLFDVPHSMRLVQARLWGGMQMGGIADFSANLFIDRANGSAWHIASFGWDHYAEPTGPHQITQPFPGGYAVEPGDKLRLLSDCVPIGWHIPAWGVHGAWRQEIPLWAHHQVWVDWSE